MNSFIRSFILKLIRLFVLLILFSLFSTNIFAVTYYSRASAAWNVNSTWSTVGHTSGTNTGSFPIAGDIVFIGGSDNVTISTPAACTTLNFSDTGTSSNLTISGSTTLSVSGAISMVRPGSGFNNTINVNAGTLTAGSLTMGATNNSRFTTINITSGTVTLGNVATSGASSRFIFTGAGTLNFGGTTTWTGTPTLTPSAGCTVNYSASIGQTILGIAYQNLIFSGSGIKTMLTGTSVASNFSLNGNVTATTVANLTVGSVLTISNGCTLTTGNNFTLGVTGASNITGSLVLGGTGTKTFTGNITLNSGAVWNETGNSTINVAGSFTNDATTFTSNNGTHNFTGAAKTLNGATETSIANVAMSGSYTNNGIFTSRTTLSGNGTFINGASGVLKLEGTYTITNLTTSASGNTVNYAGANQTVRAQNYSNLTLSGTNTKTLQTSTTSIGGNFTLSGSTATTAVVGLTIGGNVTLGSGTSFTAGSFTHNIAGNWTNNGGTFTTSTSTINFTGNSSSINGTAATQTFNNFTVNKISGQTLSVGGSTTAIVVNGTTLLTAGNFAAPVTLTANGNFTNNSGGFQSGTSTVIMAGNTSTINGSASSIFYNLTINKTTDNRQNLGVNTFVERLLTLSSGIVALSNFNFTFGANALAVQGSPSASNMIVATGTGRARKTFSSAGSFLLPIGEETGTAEYSPFTVTISSANFAPGALVEVHVTDAKHPNDNSTINHITRYWTVSQVGITNMTAAIEAHFVLADIVGTYENIITSRYIAPEWVEQNVASATSISAGNIIAFGDFTGRNNLPILNVSPLILSGFTYLEGFGPSDQQTFSVNGSALNTNITILPPDSFEISTLSGASFSPSSLITVNVVNREVSTTTIYVRLKAGFNVGNIVSENIQCSSTGVTNVNVNCSGSVTDAPLISPSVSQLTNFSYRLGNGPSASQFFTLNGSNLLGNILVTAPTNYEIQSGVSAYGSSLTFTPAQIPVQINVRLKAGLLVSNYSENILLTTQNGITKTVNCVGDVNTATVAVSKFTMAGFIYTVSQGPSSIQSFIASGTNLTGNLVVTPPTNFEISTDSLNFTLSAISITPVSNAASSKIYVRMRATLPLGTVASQKITVTSTGAISQTVACSGQVVDTPTTISSIGILNGFFYISGQGPSVKQTINVSATGLSSPITVTAPVHYEISLSGIENTFVSNGDTLSIPNSNGKVNAVPIYIRLKSGWPVGEYNSENIQLTATGADAVNVVCNGKVVVAPTIEAGPAGLDPTCPNENITLTASGTGFTNVSWTGPNGFYSTTQNPPLGVVTAANNGTYTVTGSSSSGVNLITNGDFELGNVDFGSTYTFREIGGTSNPYGVYWIKASPSEANSAYFLNTADHTTIGTFQMIVDGSETPGTVIWSQTISVSPNSDFLFSYFGQNVNNTSDTNYGKLQLYVNNIPYGAVNTLSVKAWVEFKANINVGNNSTIQLTLINTHIGGQGNDFAIDDISFQQVVQVSSSVTLNVVPTLSPALVVTASNNPVFANTIVTYTATPTNGGATPIYQWQVNGINQGAPTTSKTFEYSPLQDDSISCIMTSNYKCISPQSAANYVIMTVNPRTNYWRGNISTNWGTPENWTGGYVPAAGDDVEFAKKSNNNGVPAERNLQLDINRTIGYLINDSASLSVIIPPNLTLIVNNSIQSTSNPDKVIVQASTILPNGSIIYRNSQSLPVFGTVEMYSPASWNKEGGFNNVYNWQFFGIPVTSVPALPTFYGAYVRELFENDKDTATHWRSLKNESVLQPFIGYELCQQNANTLYTFKGQLVNSNYSSGQFIKTTDALYPGQHLFANPYTSAMDIKLIEFGAGVEATAYLYATGTFVQWRNLRNNIAGAIPGQYFAVPKNQAGIPGIPRQVPSMGTLMVRIPPGAQSSELSFVKFNYNNVAMGNSERQRTKAASTTDNQTTTTIDVEGDNGADKMWIMSHESYTRGFDNGFDGKKLIGNALSPQLYAIEKDGKYQVNSLDDINNTTLAFQAGQDTEYKMTFTHDENAQVKYKKMYLHDLVENKIIDISQSGTSYNFTAASTTKPIIRFKVLSQSSNEELAKTSNTKVYYFDNQLFVQNFSEFEGKVYVYDISGRTVGIKSISANQNIQIATPKNNTYIVKIVVGSISETSKIFLQ